MNNKRFMIIVLGPTKGIDDDLNNIADGDYGVNYVDGNGIFIGTFYSHYTTSEIHELLLGRPAFLIFDITDGSKNAVNLPSKYYKGLFPEIDDVLPIMNKDYQDTKEEVVVENDLTSIDQIIDKLKENNYDESCLTEKESEILKNY